MLTCVTDGRRARQAKEYESHPRSPRPPELREKPAAAARTARKLQIRPQVTAGHEPGHDMPKPGLTGPTRIEPHGRRPSPRRWPPLR